MLITMLKTPLISVLKPHRLINNKHTKAPDMGMYIVKTTFADGTVTTRKATR